MLWSTSLDVSLNVDHVRKHGDGLLWKRARVVASAELKALKSKTSIRDALDTAKGPLACVKYVDTGQRRIGLNDACRPLKSEERRDER
jgi:hypothetical protein